jgi:hypothetical protein
MAPNPGHTPSLRVIKWWLPGISASGINGAVQLGYLSNANITRHRKTVDGLGWFKPRRRGDVRD